MPIGWQRNNGHVLHRRSEAVRAPTWSEQVRALAQTVVSTPIWAQHLRSPAQTVRTPPWSEQVRALAQTVVFNLSGVEPAARELVPTLWSRWATAGDEKVCPVCGPYAGRAWPLGEGPSPPLHPNCRCARHYAFTTWQTRGS